MFLSILVIGVKHALFISLLNLHTSFNTSLPPGDRRCVAAGLAGSETAATAAAT